MIICIESSSCALPALPGAETSKVVVLDPSEKKEAPTCPVSGCSCRANSLQLWDPTADLRCLTQTFHQLNLSGWYWGAISAGESRTLLQDTPEGTFLVRDSNHPMYIFTLSVKTGRGPTSVRIEYNHGHFRLDSSISAKPRLHAFPDVLSLVQHYVTSCPVQSQPDRPGESTVVMRLMKPLHLRHTCPSLQHLSRLALNHSGCRASQLPLPRPLQEYLLDYPFHL